MLRTFFRRSTITLSLLGLLGALVVPGCAQVLGIEETELSDSCNPAPGSNPNNSGLSYGPGLDFSCVGVDQADPVTDTVTVILNMATFIDGGQTPVPGLTVRVCETDSDTACSRTFESDENGQVLVELAVTNVRGPNPFRGYMVIESKDDSYIPYLLYFARPIVCGDTFPVFMVTPDDFQNVFIAATGANAEIGDERGWIVLDARDCTLATSKDVRYFVEDGVKDDETVEFYFTANGGLTTENLKTVAELPLGGFIHLQPDTSVTVTSRYDPDGDNVLLAQKDVRIRAGYLTTLRFEPNE